MPIETDSSLTERILEKLYLALWALSLFALPAIPLADAALGWMMPFVVGIVGFPALLHRLDMKRSRRFAARWSGMSRAERATWREGVEAYLDGLGERLRARDHRDRG